MVKKLLKNLCAFAVVSTMGITQLSAQITYNTDAWDFELDSGVTYKSGGENVTGDIVSAWTQVAGFEQSTDQAHSGTYSCKSDFTTNTTSGKFQTYRSTTGMEGDFNVISSVPYTAIAWFYFASGTPSGTFKMSLQKSGGTNVSASFNLSAVPVGQWTKIEAEFSGNPDASDETWSSVQFSSVPTGTVVYVDDISVVQSATLGVKANTLEGVWVYPNPTANVLNVKCPAGTKMEVYNILGAKVKTQNSVQKNAALNVSGLASGLYVVKLNSEGKTATKKFQVK